jgi:hypothetical protein
MIRIREISDPELKQKIIVALAERRGMSPASIPEWFELDDADYVDLLNDLKPPTQEDYDEAPDGGRLRRPERVKLRHGD